jgi:hypothetical protein
VRSHVCGHQRCQGEFRPSSFHMKRNLQGDVRVTLVYVRVNETFSSQLGEGMQR